MLLVGFQNINFDDVICKHPQECIKLNFSYSEISNDNLISFIELIKESSEKYKVVCIDYIEEVLVCLNALEIEFLVIYREDNNTIPKYADNGVKLEIDENLTEFISKKYNLKAQDVVSEQLNNKQVINYNLEFNNKALDVVDKSKKITLEELIENDMAITEADVRELKSITNQFKMAMILQAQSRLKTVLKLCNVLDKLYNELVDRIDVSLATTDTASLMYTTDYIEKALSETNQFIMSLITNEKIQNFFIIENSNIINVTDNKLDMDKREKIRKATEIVLENTDYFTSGEYSKIINPNTVFDDEVN